MTSSGPILVIDRPDPSGAYIQVNWVAAGLPLPTSSVKTPAATSIVTSPDESGVNVAVYSLVVTPVKLLRAPLVTVTSPTSKSVVALETVKVRVSVASSEAESLSTSSAVMVTTGSKYIWPLRVPASASAYPSLICSSGYREKLMLYCWSASSTSVPALLELNVPTFKSPVSFSL